MLTMKKGAKVATDVVDKQQKKVAHQVKSSALTDEQKAVDRVVEIDADLKLAGAYTLLKELDEEKKTLQSIAKNFPPTQEVVFKGTIGEVTYSAGRRETVVTNKESLIKKLGQKLFNELAQVSLTDLKKYLSEEEIKQFTLVDYGSRSLKTVKKYDD